MDLGWYAVRKNKMLSRLFKINMKNREFGLAKSQ